MLGRDQQGQTPTPVYYRDSNDKPAQDLTDFTKLQYLELSLREPYITRDDYDRAVDLAVKRLRDDQRRYHQKHQDRTEQRARQEKIYKEHTSGDVTVNDTKDKSIRPKENPNWYPIQGKYGFERRYYNDKAEQAVPVTGKAEPVDCTGLPLIRMGQTASKVNDTPKASPEWADQGTKSVKRTEPKDLVSGPFYQGQTYCSCGMCEGERR